MTIFSSRSRTSHLLLAILLLAQLPVSGQMGNLQEFEGTTIESVEYQGNRTLTQDTLDYYLGIQTGDALSQEQLNAKLRELWDTGLVDDLRIEGKATTAGVALTVTLVERPIVRSIEYEGIKRLSRTDIEDRLATDRIQIFEGDNLRLGELRRVESSIEALYREKGYRFADARYEIQEISPSERRVTFTVDEGNRVRIEDIKFEGNTVFSDFRLRFLMKKTKQSNLLWKVTKKDVYNPAKLQEDLESVKVAYKKEGYKNVTFGDPIVEVRALNPNAATPEQRKRRMFITVPLEEGERWKFGELTIKGNDRYSDSQLLSIFESRSGDWLRSKKIEEGIEAVDELYRNTGFINARVAPELIEQDDRIADLVVHIDEGDQYRVGRIEFDGNTRTRDKVLRRELRVQEGLTMSLRSVQNSLLKIRQLGYFAIDEEDPVKFDVDDEKKTLDLTIKGQEADRTELQFGGGWSEFDGFFGQFSVRTQNFMGRGETLGASFQSGRTRDFFDLSYFVPWFLDRPQSIGLQLFSRQTDFGILTGLEQLRKQEGGSLTYGRSFGLFNSISMTYIRSKFEDQLTLLQTSPDGTIEEVPVRTEFTQSALRPVYAYNSVDSPFEPTRGKKLRLSVDYAGGFLGGTQSFIRPNLTFTLYQPVTQGRVKTVFGMNAEVTYISAFDDYELNRFDRLFLGGESSVRGFPFREISVRDENGEKVFDQGIQRGGDKLVQLNLEYHFLTGSPFRFILFADAGGVYDEDQSIDFDGLRYSAGAEIRVLLPLFGAPLRFIYAENLDPLPGDRFESLDFTIGASF
ncbi:MAG: outer membrane protein assembly factor BamA [Deltaproteobacteria bacterium]|nr:outer membrane protein assembly factor BamA [Deltaproteobacteria bacterium]